MKLRLKGWSFFCFMKKTLFLLLLCSLSFPEVLAQTHVEGQVKDATGKGLPFVSLVFEHTSRGTNADQYGYFSLVSPGEHQAVVVSFMGYKSLRIPLKSSWTTDLEIILEEEASQLGAVKLLQGRTSKKNNPALEILRKIRENRRTNGVKAFEQYEYQTYEKLEFALNGLDSTVIRNPLFKGMEFIFDYTATDPVKGKTILPVFINEAVSMTYGDNLRKKEKEVLLGNRNSGFSENQKLIAAVREVYDEYDIYSNYLKIYDKSFVSPLAETGIHNYNYVLTDSSYIGDKWCYQVMFYPRRKNELTFNGEFWVNDTTWTIKRIAMEASKEVNLNWVRNLEIEQEFQVLNDAVFLLKKDVFHADFSFSRKERAKGINASRTRYYTGYIFDRPRKKEFFSEKKLPPAAETYRRDTKFWETHRTVKLDQLEEGTYEMLDSLTRVRSFKRLYDLATIAESGYVEFKGWDFGPVYSLVGYNEVEGVRIRGGGRTYFGQNDPWRVEAYLAYGFKDQQVKYGIQGKWLLDPQSRFILSGGKRRDIEQLGASLTNTTDVLGKSLASSSLLSVGDNDKLSNLDLWVLAMEAEPLKNMRMQVRGSFRKISSASPAFSLAYFTDEQRGLTTERIEQAEIATILSYTPGRRTTGYGVDRGVSNSDEFPTFFLNYSLGLKQLYGSDFDYKKLQFFYDQPLFIGGFGRAHASLEMGRTFGTIPLGLLHVIPGNQTYFSIYNSFPVLDFYEFVTDTYIAAHFRHNFNGRLFARVPGLRTLNLRELIGLRGVWGQLSRENRQLDASGLSLQAPDQEPYWESSVGIGNILKFLTVEAHFRGNYFNVPEVRNMAITFSFGFHF